MDYITGKLIKDGKKEQVRQQIAAAFFREYNIALSDMEPDFGYLVAPMV